MKEYNYIELDDFDEYDDFDGYDYLYEQITKLKEEKDICFDDRYIVYYKQKHSKDEDYRYETTILEWNYHFDKYIWDTDWWEGDIVELIGITPVSELYKIKPMYSVE